MFECGVLLLLLLLALPAPLFNVRPANGPSDLDWDGFGGIGLEVVYGSRQNDQVCTSMSSLRVALVHAHIPFVEYFASPPAAPRIGTHTHTLAIALSSH